MDQPARLQAMESRDDGQTREGRAEVMFRLASEMLEQFGSFRFVAHGSSMIPAIFPGDILLVCRDTVQNARPGNIVLFSRDGRFWAHRLVEKSREGERLYLITRGDALAENDPPVAADELLGHVAALVRRGKRIELDARPCRSELLLRWAVRRSAGAAKWLLRWHSLRTRLAVRSRREFTGPPPEVLECV